MNLSLRLVDAAAFPTSPSIPNATALRERVYQVIADSPNGITCDDVESMLGERHQSVSARVRELVQAGRIHDTGTKRKTRGGRWARVYRVHPVNPVVEPVSETKQTADEFYRSTAWLTLRYRVIMKYGGCCQACGHRPGPGTPLHVDHIKPRSKYPELALVIENLQCLCAR
jgi:predicted transcriptional regulator